MLAHETAVEQAPPAGATQVHAAVPDENVTVTVPSDVLPEGKHISGVGRFVVDIAGVGIVVVLPGQVAVLLMQVPRVPEVLETAQKLFAARGDEVVVIKH